MINKKSNGTYFKRFRYKDAYGEWQYGYVSAKKKSECEAKYIKFMSDLENRTTERQLNVDKLFRQYIKSIELSLKNSSIKSASDVLTLYVLPYFAGRQVSNLTVRDIENWKEDIESKGFKWKYKSKIYCAFTAMINYAMKHEYVTRNVVSLAGNFKNKEIKEEDPFWTLEDFKKVYAQIDDPTYRAYFTFLFFTGVRKNEATCLTWLDFSPDMMFVRINKTLNRKGCKNGSTYEITAPKTKRSNRTILLPDCLRDELNEYYEYCKQFDGFSDKVFVFGIVKPLTEQSIRRRLDSYAEKANVPKIKVHALRHSHDSYLHSLGVSDFEIAAISGRTVRVTEDVYIHTYDIEHNHTRQLINTTLK